MNIIVFLIIALFGSSTLGFTCMIAWLDTNREYFYNWMYACGVIILLSLLALVVLSFTSLGVNVCL